MIELDTGDKKEKILKKRDTCVLPGEVNTDVVSKSDEKGDKICYYEKCNHCGKDDCIVFHPCIHKWICFGCKKTFGGEEDEKTGETQVTDSNPAPPADCATDTCEDASACPMVTDNKTFCDEESGHKHKSDHGDEEEDQ